MARSIIPTRAIVPFLVAMMLFTGACNTLLTKYQVRCASAAWSAPRQLTIAD